MDKINGNYLTQQNKDFPLDCEALDYIAKNAAIVETLGNIGGDKVVLSGCELTSGGTVRTEGYVFLRTKDFPNGEVLKWEGGQVGTMCLKKEDIGVTADGYKYPKAYTRRYLAAGMGEENYKWADFSDLKTNIELARQVKELEEQIAGVAREPLGIVKMWAGRKIPAGYLLCDGKEYLATDPEYSKLYEAIGDTFNGAKNANGAAYATQSGYFRVPDLQGRFIVGYNSSDSEYSQSGLSGGEKTHLLTPDETALVGHGHGAEAAQGGGHTHGYSDAYFSETGGNNEFGNSLHGSGDSDDDNSIWQVSRTTGSAGAHTHKISITDCAGSDAQSAHENRPPYYVLAYIMKYK